MFTKSISRTVRRVLLAEVFSEHQGELRGLTCLPARMGPSRGSGHKGQIMYAW